MNEVLVLSNPRRRKHHKGHRRHYKRNPMGLNFGNALGQVKDGALGAVGGLANDLAYGYVKGYLPAPLQDGYGRIGAKLGLAVLVGLAANKLMPGKGRAIAVGAATVVLHEAGKALLNANAPSLPLGAYEDSAALGYEGSAQTVGAYMRTGAYMPASAGGSAMNGDMLSP